MITTRIGLLCVLTFLAVACSNDPATPEAETTTPAAQGVAPTVPPAADVQKRTLGPNSRCKATFLKLA